MSDQPAWSFPGRPKNHLESIGPGPGAYAVTPGGSRAGFSFGPRDAKDKISYKLSDAPGPGAYDSSLHDKGPSWSFGIKTGSALGPQPGGGPELNPGPGAYNVNDGNYGPQFSIGGKYRDLSAVTLGPGPGAYAVDNSLYPSRSIRMGNPNEKRFPNDTGMMTPGPGAYNPPDNPNMRKPPAFSLRSRVSDSMEPRRDGPGPGQYSTASPDRPRGAYLMRPETAPQGAKIDKDNMPGPGAYTLPEARNNIAPTLKGRLPVHAKDMTPGPGAYAIDDYNSVAMGKTPARLHGGGRFPERDQRRDAPGPGAYNTNPLPSGKTVTIKGRVYAPDPRADGPGPGAYDTGHLANPIRPGGVKYSTNSAPRFKGDSTDKHTVGPGQYHNAEKPSGPAFSIRGRPRDRLNIDGPGPGAYAPPDLDRKTNGVYLMRNPINQSPSNKHIGDGPGPGAYDARPIPKTIPPAYSLGGRPKIYEKDSGPGPGAYLRPATAPHDGSKGPAMGSGQRTTFVNPRDIGPGPGEYNHQGGQQGPVITIKGRVNYPDAKDDTPGPGSYQVNADQSRVGGKINTGRRFRDGLNRDGPGPGAYDGTPIGRKPPAFSIKGRWHEPDNVDSTTMYRPIRNRFGDNAFMGRRAWGQGEWK